MANLRHDFRGRAPQKYGKTTVTFPYGDTRFVRIVAQRTARKGTREALQIPFLTPFPDQASYPGALLISQVSDGGDDTDKNITETYETLPGPIFVDIRAYRETGIPMLTSRQRVAANADYVAGEFAPTAINVISITDDGNGSTCTVTLDQPHNLPPKCWVIFGGTNSTPAILGNQKIVGVPSPTQITIGIPVTVDGTAAGMIRAVNIIQRELQPVPNNASVLMKIDTMVAVPGVTDQASKTINSIVPNGLTKANVNFLVDHGVNAGDWVTLSGTNSTPKADGPHKVLTVGSTTQFTIEFAMTINGSAGTMTPMGPLATYNEDVHCWKDFDFPDFLKAANFWSSSADTSGYNGFNFALSWGGTVAPQMQDGYRGPCRARRLRCFFVGTPPTSFEANLSPTFIMPSSGTFVVQGGSQSKIFTPDGSNFTLKESTDFKTGRIPHCLTGPSPSVTTIVPGDATAILNMIQSVPAKFTQGDIITLMGQPSKYDAGALWEVVVFLIVVPYTSGNAPA